MSSEKKVLIAVGIALGCLLLVGTAAVTFFVLSAQGPARLSTEPATKPVPSVGEESLHNGIAVKINKVTDELVQFTKPFTRDLDWKHVLRIEISVANRSEAKKLDFSSYVSGLDSSLRDEHGNKYHQCNRNSPFEAGRSGRVDPGDSRAETLLFEMPLAKSQKLTLTLKGRNVGSDTDLQFVLTRADWETAP